jgi:hypothetical protein
LNHQDAVFVEVYTEVLVTNSSSCVWRDDDVGTLWVASKDETAARIDEIRRHSQGDLVAGSGSRIKRIRLVEDDGFLFINVESTAKRAKRVAEKNMLTVNRGSLLDDFNRHSRDRVQDC